MTREQTRIIVCERRRSRRVHSDREQLTIRVTAMVTAIVFVKAEVARISEVAEEIATLNGVSEVYSVTGTIDLIVMIRVSNHDQVAEVVADQLNKVAGVVSTETHVAFRAYSAHDLEAAFSLGG
jgi:DNA-binding Lrp family transcriptional regulator